jgi:hypothetical protein
MRLQPQRAAGVSTATAVATTAIMVGQASSSTARANERTLTPIAVLPAVVNPDTTVAFEGTATLNGEGVEGARILAIETTSNTVVDTTMTDANGQYATKQLTLNGNIYHLVAQYDDGTDRYNAPSKPYLTE